MPLVEESLFLADSGEPDLVGRVVDDRYRIDEPIGRGGMGWVFRATHLVMQQTVALKVMRRDVARDMAAVKRFSKEARDCSRLLHHNTIKVHDFGVTRDGYPYLVMEHLHGTPLDDVIRNEAPLRLERVVRIGTQILRSLDEAHEMGLVHRDLKPANIFLTQVHNERDYVKVLDFGIAKTISGEAGETLTGTGMIVGTPKYLSPEQAMARPLDRRSDLYAFGVLLYEMIVGAPPFEAPSIGALLSKQLSEAPPPVPAEVAGRPVPPDLRALVAALLEKEADRRPATAIDVAERLEALLRRPAGAAAAAPTHDPPARGAGVTRTDAEDDEIQPTEMIHRAPRAAPTPPSRPAAATRSAAPRPAPAPAPQSISAALPAAPVSVETHARHATLAESGPRRRRIYAGLAAVVVVGVLALVIGLPSGGEAPPEGPRSGGAMSTSSADPPARVDEPPPAAPLETPAAEAMAAVVTAPDAGSTERIADGPDAAGDPAATSLAPVPVPVPEPEPIVVRIVSKPPGATVRADDQDLGETPVELRLLPGAERVVELSHRRYRTRSVTISSSDAPELEVGLEPAPRTKPRFPPKPGPDEKRDDRPASGPAEKEPVKKEPVKKVKVELF